jgi:RNA polymerase sigma-70 factor (ECF subfamily)
VWDNLKKGDEKALGELYNLHIDSLFSYGIQHSQDRGYIMDCIHDLFIDLHKYRKNIPTMDNGKYYLFKCLKRKINKKYQNKTIFLTYDSDYLIANSIKNYSKSHEDDMITMEREQEKKEKLSMALDTLSKKQRKGLFLRYIKEKSYVEISGIMDVSIQTARTIVYRALKTLRS